ncbi:MAG: 16S rRNA (cytosine(1402)-N(4))-methyltransferase RsmH [Candidatus Omnitrophica bacterium]|nr:16S rRNA (cytosine(1402)-N(4))-methyltransferase RsmH [Candidatus Omnitrophota bacterium]
MNNNQFSHYPVLYREVLQFLQPETKKCVVDCTLGLGGHAEKIIARMPDGGAYLGLDKDSVSVAQAARRIGTEGAVAREFIQTDFSRIDEVLGQRRIPQVDGVLFDLGISSFQLADAERGFSFLQDGPLDMRMDQNSFLSAYDLVNNLSEKELTQIFRRFGEERFASRIAHRIVAERKKTPFYSTAQLAEFVAQSVPSKYRFGRIHPATRVFQALRIAVNRELEAIETGVRRAVELLAPGGRIVVISFHSLEDRIIKHMFRAFAGQELVHILTKKPVVPGEGEIAENPRSRSAKLRAAEKSA